MRSAPQALALALLVACGGPRTVSVEAAAVEPGAWRTYSVRAVPGPDGEAYRTLLAAALAEAAAGELEARGYVAAEEPDLRVEFDLHTERRIEERAPASTLYRYVPTGAGADSTGPASELQPRTETTLFVSVLDPREPRVVWEGARLVLARSEELADARFAATASMHRLFDAFPYVAGRSEPVAVETTSALDEYGPVAEAGDPGAQYLLGRMHSVGHGAPRDLEAARSWYERAAEQGHPGARASLGLLLLEGPEELRDAEAAARWLRLAAEQGVASAQFACGRLLLQGGRTDEDDASAAHWLRLAADQGLAAAQTDYATLLLQGRGVEQDAAAAARWYRRAAEQGEPRAMTRLAMMLELGRGGEKDELEAATWYLLAADRGDRQALERLQRLAPRLEPGQLEEAERRALAWRPAGDSAR